MNKKSDKTPKSRKTRGEKVRELINFAEELVGRDCIVKEDLVLARHKRLIMDIEREFILTSRTKSAFMEDFSEKTLL